ncbi:glycoside hydrolase family 2 TIM barrel-domain containing protein [Massilia sp. CFBP9012]|uniref:glycoside hydrolase family 2 TIM barrel-domain containing protein n=1 Tax=Massilia sp. CFBP9012 TaxID=3096531 RepID=UPI002A69EDB5|nr:glycoside hydrolase family 2 TIM barrel-domain containing protein [Massilia sp. CFBP9012]MDY0973526.1 glycoside hydrolase family 2 TIM barrel-domain containing protein [Massilia sp. CFBP9012]
MMNIVLIPIRAVLLALALAAPVQAADLNLNASWLFYRDEAGQLASADQVPDGAWTEVNLPYAARIEPRVPTAPWQGTAFYKKRLDVTLRPGERAILRFEGVMNVADVWLNGRHLGQHLGGYLPFAFDVTDTLRPVGANELVVRANNEDNPITGPKPLKQLDYIQHGGIYRDVRLVIKPPVHVTDEMLSATPGGGGVFVTYPRADKGEAQVKVKAEVSNTSKSTQTVTVRHTLAWEGRQVAQAEQQLRLKAGERRHVTMPLTVRAPRLWSPQTPNLYRLETRISAAGREDLVATRIGVRRLAFEGGRLLLNGEPLRLRGVNRHQEYPYVGYALSPQADARDALLIKRYGFDFVRLSHYPQSPAFMAAADELGLMVLPAIPGWQFHNPDPAFARQALRTCADMIRRDRNHASVVAWECSLNETDMPDPLVQALHATVHQEYPGDQAWSAGWVPHTYDLYLQARQHRIGSKHALPAKPLIVSEYGDWEYYAMNAGLNQDAWADLKPVHRSSRQALGSGETRLLQQARNVAEAHDDNAATPAFADGYWVMFDYARGYAPDLEESGLLSIERLPKFAAEFFRSQRSATERSPRWGGGPMVFIASYWQANSNPRVRVFSNAQEVELRLNGKPVGRQKSTPSGTHPRLAHPPLEFDTGGFAPGELVALAYAGGRVVAEHRVRTPQQPTTLALELDDVNVPVVEGDLVFLRARLRDANGTTVPATGTEVAFSGIEGAQIVGSHVVATEAGIASVLVRVTGPRAAVKARAQAGALGASELVRHP